MLTAVMESGFELFTRRKPREPMVSAPVCNISCISCKFTSPDPVTPRRLSSQTLKCFRKFTSNIANRSYGMLDWWYPVENSILVLILLYHLANVRIVSIVDNATLSQYRHISTAYHAF